MVKTSIIPIFDNVVTFFVKEILPSLRNPKNNDVDVYFDFGEDSNRIFNNYNDNNIENVIKVRDVNKFFDLLTKLYELDIDKYCEHENKPYSYIRMNTFFRDIWVRASDLDFENIEDYLEKQVEKFQ